MSGELVHVAQEHRYRYLVDGEMVGVADYHDVPGARVVTHTEIDPAREGQGLGGAMVQAVLADIAAAGLHVVPLCSFVAAFIRRHPEHAHLLGD